MKNEDRTVLTSLLVQICRDMFTPNGEALEELSGVATTPPDRENLLASSIGLSGSTVRGALVVVARPAFFSLPSPPERGVPRSDADVADWPGGVVNPPLGWTKTRLPTYGLDFSPSPPTVVRGDRLQLRV